MHNEKIHVIDNFCNINFSGHFSVPTICIHRDSLPVLRNDKGVAIVAFGKHFRSICDASFILDAATSAFAMRSQKMGYMAHGGDAFCGIYPAHGGVIS